MSDGMECLLEETLDKAECPLTIPIATEFDKISGFGRARAEAECLG